MSLRPSEDAAAGLAACTLGWHDRERRLLVIGDAMLDETVTVRPARLSPEQGHAVVHDYLTRGRVPGGAARTVACLQQLLGYRVPLWAAFHAQDRRAQCIGLHQPPSWSLWADDSALGKLTHKQRVQTEDGTLLLRVDRDMRILSQPDVVIAPVEDAVTAVTVAATARPFAPQVVLVSDYGKGVVALPDGHALGWDKFAQLVATRGGTVLLDSPRLAVWAAWATPRTVFKTNLSGAVTLLRDLLYDARKLTLRTCNAVTEWVVRYDQDRWRSGLVATWPALLLKCCLRDLGWEFAAVIVTAGSEGAAVAAAQSRKALRCALPVDAGSPSYGLRPFNCGAGDAFLAALALSLPLHTSPDWRACGLTATRLAAAYVRDGWSALTAANLQTCTRTTVPRPQGGSPSSKPPGALYVPSVN